jgi:hypothetical protein
MPKFTITITDVEAAALAHVMDDPQEWAQNAITHRACIATDEIVARETARMIADPNITQIPATAAEIVMAAELPAPPSIDLPVLPEA